MGFLSFVEEPPKRSKSQLQYSAEMYAQGCKVCPLRTVEPKLEPTGSSKPVLYFLGEAPGHEEVKAREQFVGKSGQLLRERIPSKWKHLIRWNNCLRSHPTDKNGENRAPTTVELGCCRKSIVDDIEAAKPKAIFGFGNVPLNFIIGKSGISNWHGRHTPVQVGKHKCWFFPFLHPASILHLGLFPKPIYSATDCHSDLHYSFVKAIQLAFPLIDGLPEPIIDTREDAMLGVECLRNPDEIIEAIWQAYDSKHAGLDYETNRLRPFSKDSKILSIALSFGKRHVAFPFDHPSAGFSSVERRRIGQAFTKFLHDSPCIKIAHNIAFEQEWSANKFGDACVHGSAWEDSQAQAYVLDEREGGLSLGFLCQQHFGLDIKALSNLNRKQMENYSLEEILPYNAVDSKYCRMLFSEQKPELERQGLMEVYQHHVRRISALTLTQLDGIPLNRATSLKLKAKYQGRLDKITDEITALPVVRKYLQVRGKPYRPSAPDDIKFIVNKMLVGGPSIEAADEEALKEVDHPIAQMTINWKKASKNITTYIDPFLADDVVYPDGKLHPVFSTMRVRTSRTSADSPNVQNEPKRQEEHKEVRAQIEAPPGHKVVSIDYSGIQARNVAMESKDRVLIKAFFERYDIHTDWMEQLVRIYPAWVKEGVRELAHNKDLQKAYRHLAKNKFVFPSFFGAWAPTVAGYLEIPDFAAKKLQENFWSRFANVKKWHHKVQENFYRDGYVTGLSGYRRHAPCGYNEIINSPIQADETIIVMSALIRLSELGEPEMQPKLEVHDDLTFIWPDKNIDRNLEIAAREMLKIEYDWINVPLGIEASIGQNWHEMRPIGEFESIGRDQWREITK